MLRLQINLNEGYHHHVFENPVNLFYNRWVIIVLALSTRDRLYTSEYDICRRQFVDIKLKKTFGSLIKIFQRFNPFKPEFTIVIFIHYKPRIAVSIPDL